MIRIPYDSTAPKPLRASCYNCGCLFEYDLSDTTEIHVGLGVMNPRPPFRAIDCPKCKTQLSLEVLV